MSGVSPKTMRVIFVILAAFLLVGCHESGTWKDDARMGDLFLSDTQL